MGCAGFAEEGGAPPNVLDDLSEWRTEFGPDTVPNGAVQTACRLRPVDPAALKTRAPPLPTEWTARPGWPVPSSPSLSPGWDDDAGEWGSAAAAATASEEACGDDEESQTPVPAPDIFCADLGPLDMWGAGGGRGALRAEAASGIGAAGFDLHASSPSECFLGAVGAGVAAE